MDRILRLREVCEVTGLAKSTIRRAELAHTFPRRRRIGLRSVGWLESQVQAWLASRARVVLCDRDSDGWVESGDVPSDEGIGAR